MLQLTKKAIIESFVKLLNERTLDKIKVKDIAEECGINRNTFYYHFEDIHALMEELLRLETERVLLRDTEEGSWEEAFIQAAEFALQNKRAVYHIYNSAGRDIVKRYLNAMAEDVMTHFVERIAQGIAAGEEDKKLVVCLYRAALVGMIEDWLEAGMKYDVERIIRRVGLLFEGNISRSLERSAKECRNRYNY